jgi:hypothetical protein
MRFKFLLAVLLAVPASRLAAQTIVQGGPTAGTDYLISRYNSSGTLVDTPFKIGQSTGAITLSGPLNLNASGSTGDISGMSATTTNGTTARSLATRGGDVFNIADYGAKCDGTTNDNTAVNAAVAAAASSLGYLADTGVTITGPSGSLNKGCIINSINATLFQRANGSNLGPRVTFRDMTFICQGAGNVCFDGLGSKMLKLENISIKGAFSTSAPEICVQLGIIGGASAAWHALEHVNCDGNYTFTALYNSGAEATTYIDSMFSNGGTLKGPLGTLGTITPGSSYTDGTYSLVPLTGGTGSGALATITVSGGAVTGVSVAYEGRDYAPSDTLSAAAANVGGTGSGFSIPVSSIKPYSVVLDGQNHWRAASAFQTVSVPVDTSNSLTLNAFYNANIRNIGTGGAVWLTGTSGLRMVNSYIVNSNGPSCVNIYNNGVSVGIPSSNNGLDLNFNCEGNSLSSVFQMTGSYATPSLMNFKWRGYHLLTSGTTFGADSNITSVTLNNSTIDVIYEAFPGVPMFSNADMWKMSGTASVPSVTHWNAPKTMQGSLIAGSIATPPGIGPIDALASAAFAGSCARQVVNSYAGPLCQFQRTSDNATQNMYANSMGILDRAAFQNFCSNTVCSVRTLYDQSGNGNDMTNTTQANQPTVTFSTNGRASMTFGDAGGAALSAAAASSINNLFSATASYGAVVAKLASSSTQTDRLLFKSDSGVTGFEVRIPSGGTSLAFIRNASTTGGTWTTASGLGTSSFLVLDLQYNGSSLSNVPTIGSQGSTVAQGSVTQPVGSFATDASLPLILGNSALTGGTRGFPGEIQEVILWKTTPSALQLETVRRNQAAFYNISGVN